VCGAWARPRAPPTPGVASAPAGGAAEDGGLDLACGGCPVQGFAAGLARRGDGPPGRVARHQRWRRHRARGRQARRIARGPGPSRDGSPTACHPVCPAAGPGPRARDGRARVAPPSQTTMLRVRGAVFSPNAGGEARVGPLTRDRPHGGHGRGGGGADHAAAPVPLADPGAVPAALTAPSRGFAGVGGRGPGTRSHAGGRDPGDHAWQCPGACRAWPRPEPRDDAPGSAPARVRIAVRRLPPRARPCRPTHVGARGRGHRRVARQAPRPRRDPLCPHAPAQRPRQHPRRPAAPGTAAWGGRRRAWRRLPHGASERGAGPAPRRQPGTPPEDQATMGGGRGTRRAQPGAEGPGTRWNVPADAAARGGVVRWRETVATLAP